MSTVKEIESAISRLSPIEMREVHEWLEDLIEDQLEFTSGFESRIQQSESEMTAGTRPRVRQP